MTYRLFAVPLLLALSACGGGGGDGGSIAETAAPQENEPAMLDAFTSYVSELVGNTSETAGPIAIDSISPSSPEDTRPVPLS